MIVNAFFLASNPRLERKYYPIVIAYALGYIIMYFTSRFTFYLHIIG